MDKSPVEICSNHTGKMEGIHSISTSVTANALCQKQQAIAGSICSHCFAEAMMGMYSALEAKLLRNTEVLTKSILPIEELPDTTGCDIFRFESFGDLNNETQLINYLNIVKKNPGTRFTLWTKRYLLIKEYFAREDVTVPGNFTLILSSLMVNKKISLEPFKACEKFQRGQLKSFTVYDYEYIKKHYTEMDINCGSRCCIGCRNCYDQNDIEEISEVLKADQDRVSRFLRLNDPRYTEDIIGLFDYLNDTNE